MDAPHTYSICFGNVDVVMFSLGIPLSKVRKMGVLQFANLSVEMISSSTALNEDFIFSAPMRVTLYVFDSLSTRSHSFSVLLSLKSHRKSYL